MARPKSRKSSTTNGRLTKLQRFGLYFHDRVFVTLFLWLVLIAIGVFCYAKLLTREGFPRVELPVSVVSGTYFVNSAEQVDAEVTKPLSEFITQLPAVESVHASSGTNFFTLQVEHTEGTDSGAASNTLKERVANAGFLPERATLEFRPVLFGVDFAGEGDDIHISFFSRSEVSAETLEAKAKSAAEYLSGPFGIVGAERVRPVSLFRTGSDPASGQPVSEQSTFDKVGVSNGGFVFYDSAIVAVKAEAGIDDLELYDATQMALERLRNDAAFEGYDAVISANFAEGIRTQIAGLQESLLIGLLAVTTVCFLLISLRASIVAAVAMVSVITITLGIVYAVGLTLNTVTLFSLVLSLGLIVDDTIIVTEAIDAGRSKRLKRRTIVAGAIKKVALASVAGTFTTMLAFAPMLFIGGILGTIIVAIPVTVIISLAVSLLVSLTLVPFLSRLLVNRTGRSFSPLRGIESYISARLAGVISIGKRSLKRLAVIGSAAILLSIAMVVAGVVLFQHVKFNIFPAAKDTNALQLALRFPLSTDLQRAEELTGEVAGRAAEVLGPNIEQATLSGTGSASGVLLNMELIPYDEREVTSPQLVNQLETAFAQYDKADVQVRQIDVGPPPGTFGVRIYAEDRDRALQLARDIAAFLADQTVTRPTGTTARLEDVQVANETSILRSDGRKYVEVRAGFDANDTSALVTLAQDLVEEEFTPDRIAQYGLDEAALAYDFGSESDNQESFKSMVIAFPILLAAMYLLLAFQFRSLSQPLMIFLAIPFSIFGVTGGLLITNNPFSFFTLIGVFALIGISVNNTILLTDYANQARRTGKRRLEAIASAVQERFRPLLTTSLTSVVALIPLALTDPFWESLAVTLMFGLLSSTFLVVVAFPYYYLAVEVLRLRFSRLAVITWILLLGGGTLALSKFAQTEVVIVWAMVWLLYPIMRSITSKITQRLVY